ncbi:MAG: hypothetical protein A2Y73_06725 [Chloroflexi bacterium RBG_13_56_8]|nr:MAG: hypothetical protein A2Y73_06725 [Chloroflexi bacterium RBG_13_56_8]
MYHETYPLNLCGLHRELPIVPVNDDLAIASFVMPGDVPLINACAQALAERIRSYEIDALAAIEAKGLPLAHQVATSLDMDYYVLIRKGAKIYMQDPLTVEESSITTKGTQLFVLDGRQAAYLKGKRVALVDDVTTTGGSERAARCLIEKAGGIIVCEAFVLVEGNWVEERSDLVFLGRLPFFEPTLEGGWKAKEQERR